MTGVYRTRMLPKISEEKSNLEHERIQDFCASFKIENNSDAKKKLDVRSIYETDNEIRQPRDGTRPARNRAVSANKPKFSWNSSRDRLGFSRSHLFSARGPKIKNKRSTEVEETIDLTSINDAQKLTQRFYRQLGIRNDGKWSKDIESHLLKFEDADLSFPNLWNKEELFKRTIRYTTEMQEFHRKKSSLEDDTRLNLASGPGKENSTPVKTGRSFKGKKFERQLTNSFDQVFYSKPVRLGNISKHEKSILISSRHTRFASLNTRAVPPKYGSMNWIDPGLAG